MAGAGKAQSGVGSQGFSKMHLIQGNELREKMVKGYARPEGGVFRKEALKQFQMARSTVIYMTHYNSIGYLHKCILL